MDHTVTTKRIIAESIREANFGANEHAAVELDKVPLIRPAYYVVIEKDRFRSAAAEGKRAAEIPGICAACKSNTDCLRRGWEASANGLAKK
jgi:hypothetical protein